MTKKLWGGGRLLCDSSRAFSLREKWWLKKVIPHGHKELVYSLLSAQSYDPIIKPAINCSELTS